MQIKMTAKYKLLLKSVIPILMGFAFFTLIQSQSFCQVAVLDSSSKKLKDSSLIAKDSTIAPLDTIKRFPSKAHGEKLSVSNAQLEINKKDYQFEPYNSFADILETRSLGSRITLGGIGLEEGLSLFGSNPASRAFAFNSRAIGDLNFEGYNLNYVAMDGIENAQLFYGSDAAIFSDNSSGFYTNIQEARYNTSRPFTKIWFAQGSYDYLASEGVFSQNIKKDLNFTFGFRRQSAKGRFENQALDSWNVRALLRYNPTDFESFSLSDNFYNYKRGENGGVVWDSASYFDELSTDVNNATMYSRNYRHDLTLSYSNIFDSTQTNAVSINGYFSNSDWQRLEYTNALRADSAMLRKTYESSNWGFNGEYQTNILNPIKLNLGAELDNFNMATINNNGGKTGLKYSIYGQGKINFADNFSVKGGARITNFKDINLLNIGAGLDYQLSKSIAISGDVSRFDNFPFYLSKTQFENEHHNLLLSSISFKVKDDEYKLGGYYRLIQNEIVANPIMDSANKRVMGINRFALDNSSYYGFYINAKNSLKDSTFALNSKLAFDNGAASYRRAPRFSLTATPEYTLRVGRSILSAGINLKLNYDAPIIGYYPEEQAYFWTKDAKPRMDEFSNRIDVFAVAKLGNAYVRIQMRNLLSSSYYTTAVYPELDRELRISVSWAFFD